jgi:hypothetical protein
VAESDPFKWRHYQGEIILLCVRWYLRYALSYRDLEEMMRERGLSLDHTTIYRWVQAYAPKLEKRIRPHRLESGADLLCPHPFFATQPFQVYLDSQDISSHMRLRSTPAGTQSSVTSLNSSQTSPAARAPSIRLITRCSVARSSR